MSQVIPDSALTGETPAPPPSPGCMMLRLVKPTQAQVGQELTGDCHIFILTCKIAKLGDVVHKLFLRGRGSTPDCSLNQKVFSFVCIHSINVRYWKLFPIKFLNSCKYRTHYSTSRWINCFIIFGSKKITCIRLVLFEMAVINDFRWILLMSIWDVLSISSATKVGAARWWTVCPDWTKSWMPCITPWSPQEFRWLSNCVRDSITGRIQRTICWRSWMNRKREWHSILSTGAQRNRDTPNLPTGLTSMNAPRLSIRRRFSAAEIFCPLRITTES